MNRNNYVLLFLLAIVLFSPIKGFSAQALGYYSNLNPPGCPTGQLRVSFIYDSTSESEYIKSGANDIAYFSETASGVMSKSTALVGYEDYYSVATSPFDGVRYERIIRSTTYEITKAVNLRGILNHVDENWDYWDTYETKFHNWTGCKSLPVCDQGYHNDLGGDGSCVLDNISCLDSEYYYVLSEECRDCSTRPNSSIVSGKCECDFNYLQDDFGLCSIIDCPMTYFCHSSVSTLSGGFINKYLALDCNGITVEGIVRDLSEDFDCLNPDGDGSCPSSQVRNYSGSCVNKDNCEELKNNVINEPGFLQSKQFLCAQELGLSPEDVSIGFDCRWSDSDGVSEIYRTFCRPQTEEEKDNNSTGIFDDSNSTSLNSLDFKELKKSLDKNTKSENNNTRGLNDNTEGLDKNTKSLDDNTKAEGNNTSAINGLTDAIDGFSLDENGTLGKILDSLGEDAGDTSFLSDLTLDEVLEDPITSFQTKFDELKENNFILPSFSVEVQEIPTSTETDIVFLGESYHLDFSSFFRREYFDPLWAILLVFLKISILYYNSKMVMGWFIS